MKTLILLIFINAENINDLATIRNQYIEAAMDQNKIEVFRQTCSASNNSEITALGYCTMIHFLEAKHAINPYRKLSEFNKGKHKLDSLITIDSENIELRYMRHSIQDRVPGFLGYHDQLELDKDFMTTKLNSVTDSLTYQLIYNYLKSEQ